MDKNAIKKYAVWARRELIARVSQKALQYGITEKEIVDAAADSVNGKLLSADEKKQRQALIAQINEKSYEQVMEEVAYTWFNRFSALRFMEVNNYLPSHVRVFTDEDNNFKPQIITEAIHLDLDGLDMEKVYAYKDADQTEELYKYLLIVQCNALNKILPGMFQRISDYTELLLPDNLLREGSVIEQMITLIPEDDWRDAVQIIGWLYQFYNIEPKAKVFDKKDKVTKEEIPAATQLFTPDWIVRYMVENSVGRLWLGGHPNDDLHNSWNYYLENAPQEDNVVQRLIDIQSRYAELSPEKIKCIDPCMGSGHILTYTFDVLMQIYESYGYTSREAVANIVENNLWGLDIDERATQLSYFSIMMKARQYDRRFFSRGIQPHVYAIAESNNVDNFTLQYFCNGDAGLLKSMKTIMAELKDAKEYGSLVKVSNQDWSAIYSRFAEIVDDIHMSKEAALKVLLPLVSCAETLAQKYTITITNPPYMPVSNLGEKAVEYIRSEYPDSKTDLYAVFMERCMEMTQENGMQAMITMHSWMTNGSYETLRSKLRAVNLINMAHLGKRAFEEIGGEVVQTTAWVQRNAIVDGFNSTFVNLTEYLSQDSKDEAFSDTTNHYYAKRDKFENIPGAPYSYWVTENVLDLFKNARYLSEETTFRRGISTGDNNRFLRLWSEVDINKTNLFRSNNPKWYAYNKGGSFRKWYGNRDYVLLWENDGLELKGYKGSAVRNVPYQLKHCLSYSSVATGKPSFRVFDEFLNDQAGNFLTFNEGRLFTDNYIHALLNSVVGEYLIRIKNTTQNITADGLDAVPVVSGTSEQIETIERLVDVQIALAKEDWDSFEMSWDYKGHPLLMQIISNSESDRCYTIEKEFDNWRNVCEERFERFKNNEETINKLFIEIYGLQNELSYTVDDKDISIYRADVQNDVKSFISYVVGCIFGRYSLDSQGLVFAGGVFDASVYNTYPADNDNILPICDDEYFPDDIVGKFVSFIETVYGKKTLDENLKFIANALDSNGQPKEVIRNYFMNNFYSDHCSMYSGNVGKRPIYWLFDSGKKNGFKALMYIHRYQSDTIARIRTDYVHEQQARYRTAIVELENRITSAATSERVKLNKKLTALKAQEDEIRVYEEKIHHLADQMISIDLDDGFKVNYDKFKDVLAKIK